jgi:fatty acid CoA ligase FadD9
VLTAEQIEKLIARVTDLLANDPQFAAAMPSQDVSTAMLEPELGLVDVIETVVSGYADRTALARRATRLVTEDGRSRRELLTEFDTVTYRELWGQVTAIAAAMHGAGWVRPGDRVATLGFNTAGYATADMAVPLLDAVSVPLHAGAPVPLLQAIVDEIEPAVIASSAEYLGTAVQLANDVPSVRAILVFDHHPDDDDERDVFESAQRDLERAGGGVVLVTMEDAVERGAGLALPARQPFDPERLALILYTSGSSGSPKGVMIPERLVKGTWCATPTIQVTQGFALPAITVNFLPMNHIGGRSMVYSALGAGGTLYFGGKSDMSTVIEDISLTRPTQLNFVPRIWDLLHREYTSRLALGGAEDDVMDAMRTEVLGGRYVSALTGSAPLTDEIAAWLEELLDTPLIDALGATETGSVLANGTVQRPPIIEYKLADVPELGYYGTDKPHPRGELLIKSVQLFQGYYRRPELTAEVFDEDGFYRTGDVVAELAPDQLQYVDRRNNVLKLSNGEFVTVSKLESVFSTSDLVDQIYVYGNSERPYLLAVVVPTDAAISDSSEAVLETTLLRALRETAAAAGLEPYEIPRDIIVEREPFSTANGLITNTDKPSRGNLKARYGERLEALYLEHLDEEAARWNELAATAAHAPVLATVRRAAAAVLGSAGGDPEPGDRFTDLGGDSLSALSYAAALTELFGVEIDVGDVVSPAADLQSIADHIEALRRGSTLTPTFASVHGADASEVRAGDLTLDRFLDAATLEHAGSLLAPTADPRNVLLTGATGYLGRYLALEWLQRMARVGGTVTCLVRARDDASARARLDEVFDSGDDELLSTYRELSAEHLVVVAGDKGDPMFGLDKVVWQQLAETVDLIVDPAAFVNHMLPYPQLFGPNVVGVAEVIRLALTSRMKPVVNVSSIGVSVGIDPAAFTEDADIRKVSPVRQLDDMYASGYATSKWAGEVLLREAHDRCGLPVSVLRCDMIMAEPRRRGQLNLPDMVTRLVLSVAATGLAPWSFYTPDSDGGRSRAHFDGLPVDFVAEAVSALVPPASGGFSTYHALNPHDDGIGLDEYVDWMIDAGCRIERIRSHDEWFERFDSALRNLPEAKRHASLLPIVDTFRFPMPPMQGTLAPTERFGAAVAEHHLGDDGDIPGIGPANIVKYVTDLELLGLLDRDRD